MQKIPEFFSNAQPVESTRGPIPDATPDPRGPGAPDRRRGLRAPAAPAPRVAEGGTSTSGWIQTVETPAPTTLQWEDEPAASAPPVPELTDDRVGRLWEETTGSAFFTQDTMAFAHNVWASALEAQADLLAIGTAHLHPATRDLVGRFSRALADKLASAEKKYGYSDGWADPDWMDECRQHLLEHVAKGDPRDVAAYCAFLWHHGGSTTPATSDGVEVDADFPGTPSVADCIAQLDVWNGHLEAAIDRQALAQLGQHQNDEPAAGGRDPMEQLP